MILAARLYRKDKCEMHAEKEKEIESYLKACRLSRFQKRGNANRKSVEDASGQIG